MELFLLLSMGLSIVAFISIALNQTSPGSLNEQNLEVTLPIEHLLPASESINLTPQKDNSTIEAGADSTDRTTEQVPDLVPHQEALLATAEV